MSGLAHVFGLQVRMRRKALGLRQAELADATRLSEQWLRKIERGTASPSFDVVERIAAVLRVEPHELFREGAPELKHDGPLSADLKGFSAQERKWLADAIKLLVRRPGQRPT